jgi:fatty acid-binding protein DegV
VIKLSDEIGIQSKYTSLKGDEMNSKICQIADSAGSLPKEIIEKYGIYEVPFYFKFQDTDYLRENIDYSTEDFYEHIKS